jgi:hypothetical protein
VAVRQAQTARAGNQAVLNYHPAPQTITTAREQALTPGEKNLGVAVLGMICSGDCRCWRSVQPVCVSCWCIQWCFSTGDFVQADLCTRLADVSPFHLSASAWPMGVGPFSDLLEGRCGPVVGCLRSAGLRILRKVYDEIKTWGY